MKHSTEYLFDVPRNFFEPALTILAKLKIQTGRALMKKLAKRRADNELEPGDIDRYIKAEESVIWWKDILHEP